jgi:predicted Rossmann fold nucleotide-binding protein DprA/Smf involved in DNA uptake
VINALGVLVLERPKDPAASSRDADLPDVQRRLISHLNLTPKHIDVLAAEAGLGTAEASAQLTLLELAGLIHRQPGGCFIRAL